MRRRRIAALVGALAIVASGVLASPAVASETSSICAVHTDEVMGTSDTVIGVRFEAFACDGEPVEFSGTFEIRHIQDPSHYPWALDTASSSSPVESTGHGSGVGMVDVGDLPVGPALVDFQLRAPGDDAPYDRPENDFNHELVLVDGPNWRARPTRTGPTWAARHRTSTCARCSSCGGARPSSCRTAPAC